MKIKKTDEQLIRFFWDSPSEAIFSPKVIALVLNMSDSCLDKHRANGRGPRFSKMLNTTIFYRKKDVVEFLEGFEI